MLYWAMLEAKAMLDRDRLRVGYSVFCIRLRQCQAMQDRDRLRHGEAII